MSLLLLGIEVFEGRQKLSMSYPSNLACHVTSFQTAGVVALGLPWSNHDYREINAFRRAVEQFNAKIVLSFAS